MVMSSRPVVAWLRIMRSWSMTLAMAAIVLFWAFGARLYINPTRVEIIAGQVTVYRTYLLHDWLGVSPPLVGYRESVRGIGAGPPPCQDSATFRHEGESGFGSWSLSPWADDCMSGDYFWQVDWTVYAFGAIPLRPIHMSLPVQVPTYEALP